MPTVQLRVWTSRRKWLGNLIPTLFWFPIVAFGIGWMAWHHTLGGLGLVALVAAQFVGWIALDRFGLFENRQMRSRLEELLSTRSLPNGSERYFVGFATPDFASLLDAHEDVGFLYVEREEIIFVSESRQVSFQRSQARSVRFRPNVHSFLGLGRWISVEGLANGRAIRLLVEPRDAPTLFRNRALGAPLKSRLSKWLAGSPSASAHASPSRPSHKR